MNVSEIHASKSFGFLLFGWFDFYGKESSNNSWQNGGI